MYRSIVYSKAANDEEPKTSGRRCTVSVVREILNTRYFCESLCNNLQIISSHNDIFVLMLQIIYFCVFKYHVKETYEILEGQLHAFLTSALYEGEWSV